MLQYNIVFGDFELTAEVQIILSNERKNMRAHLIYELLRSDDISYAFYTLLHKD